MSHGHRPARPRARARCSCRGLLRPAPDKSGCVGGRPCGGAPLPAVRSAACLQLRRKLGRLLRLGEPPSAAGGSGGGGGGSGGAHPPRYDAAVLLARLRGGPLLEEYVLLCGKVRCYTILYYTILYYTIL